MSTIIMGLCLNFLPCLGQPTDGKIVKPPRLSSVHTASLSVKKRTFRSVRRSASTSRVTQAPNKKESVKVVTPATSPPKREARPKASPKVVATTSELDRVLDGIQRFYKSATDLKADLHQTYTYVKMGRKQVKKGRVYFKNPRRMRWDYKSPVPQVFVSDGTTLWVYEPSHAQVFKQNLKSSQLPIALTFLSGQGDLRAEFDGVLKPSKTEHHIVELTPKANEGSYRSVILTVNKSDFSVVESTVVDPVGNLNKLRFSKVKTNTGIPDRVFQFKVPKGVRIVDPPK